MVASAQPFVPGLADEGGETPLPQERPFALNGAAGRVAAMTSNFHVATAGPALERSAPERPAVKPAAAQRVTALDSAPRADVSPVATFAPAPDRGALGLMSGRGLY
jgi:hypothetical protein